MKTRLTRAALLSLAMAAPLHAADATASPGTTPTIATATEPAPTPDSAAQETAKAEQERLALENALVDERVKKETSEMRAELSRLRTEKELIAERLNLAELKRQSESQAEITESKIQEERLSREASIAKARAEALTNELKASQAEHSLELEKLQSEIARYRAKEERSSYADAPPEYLDQPLRDDGVLVISDRRIPLNGAITTDTADFVTDRIHYYNNQNSTKPIFIVIDESPGGSVMAGYRILKAMEASDAPVHVVVKSFAASMAAAITTLAKESYAYPNSVILHHQISSTLFGRLNLTEQAELLKDSQRWWDRFGTPIAAKMGISKEEFIKRMYQASSSGDWSEFGTDAANLKWVDHIVSGIEETSFTRSPDAADADSKSKKTAGLGLTESVDEEGHPVMYLPRINAKDVYFLYNPDGYYRMR
ncbi:ATP-dependent Clp protease protease subunit [Haloferula luteola]|uniref:ATP-dependent Clp protease protease subunit n=1 Tax=Haloferula luteola TaxID=595692 RepID=A0A840V4Y3_9BACT|nr:ATP-dependent Clp protease proteolytic subunit [Haloferula luteola]MBB5350694.1 ATP-dependent Clp protease protease subunit [Haloferula luteola]